MSCSPELPQCGSAQSISAGETASGPRIGRLASALQSHFRVEVRAEGRAMVLTLAGELDLASSPALEEELGKLGDPEFLIVDMRGLEFIDSTGLSVLVKAHQGAQEAGRGFGPCQGRTPGAASAGADRTRRAADRRRHARRAATRRLKRKRGFRRGLRVDVVVHESTRQSHLPD